ncbi:FadR/GntR family transcriptional regulator [Janibacter limosus]|uniref:FadR/GntR family transcriptional regulator n=1 Tax=Janibacter limosus TaxID=53458 RepID=UPI000A03B3AA|nr:GntR family transcriptional regulator [Janibacter limosus]
MGTTTGLARVRVPKTAEVVAQAIRSQIVSGDIAEGQALPSESDLMANFGVSRPSLREAFRILESEQLIEVRRGSRGGALALRPDVSVAARYLALLMQFDGVMLSEVFQARALIEPLALRLLAQQKDRAVLTQQLRDILGPLQEKEKDHRPQIWLEFFTKLFEYAGNRPLALVYGTLNEVVARELQDSIDATSNEADSLKAVSKVMKLVDAGKGEEAAAFWMNQMFLIEEQVNRLHRRKTLVDATPH